MNFLNKEQIKCIIQNIKPENILFALTSEEDYEMSRVIILENIEEYGKYFILEGFHCSCYGFKDTDWKGTEYTFEEMRKLADTWIENNSIEKELAKFVMRYK